MSRHKTLAIRLIATVCACWSPFAIAKLFVAAQTQNLGSTTNVPHIHGLPDLNGDGIRDVVATDTKSNELLILRGNGDGSFQAPTRVATGRNPTALAIGYLNGDTYLDIAVANSDDNTVSVFLGNATGGMYC